MDKDASADRTQRARSLNPRRRQAATYSKTGQISRAVRRRRTRLFTFLFTSAGNPIIYERHGRRRPAEDEGAFPSIVQPGLIDPLRNHHGFSSRRQVGEWVASGGSGRGRVGLGLRGPGGAGGVREKTRSSLYLEVKGKEVRWRRGRL